MALSVLMLAACTADQNMYDSQYQCYFYFNGGVHLDSKILNCVNTSAKGLYCTITKTPGTGAAYKLNVTLSNGDKETNNVNTADETRRSCILGANNGLIVGRSILNTDASGLTGVLYAYDLMCPNCLESYFYKTLYFSENGRCVTCPNCKRTYDLNNMGIVVNDTLQSKKLVLYHANFNNNILFVQN